MARDTLLICFYLKKSNKSKVHIFPQSKSVVLNMLIFMRINTACLMDFSFQTVAGDLNSATRELWEV